MKTEKFINLVKAGKYDEAELLRLKIFNLEDLE